MLTAEILDWYTDASGAVGFGGICGRNFFQGKWDKSFLRTCKPSIEYQELFAVAVSVLLWLKFFANKRICIFIDNETVVKMIHNCMSNCKNCMVLVRLIMLECMTWNVRLFALHISSVKNNFADALSRFQDCRFCHDAQIQGKTFNRDPDELPTEIWLVQKIWRY